MILGIGTDIVRIARIEDSLARIGERFAEKLLTQQELAEFRASRAPARLLARRFAAKEAAVKALGTGVAEGIGLSQIGVAHDVLGRPLLCWHGAARARCEQLGVSASWLSISDERDYAVACVVLEG
ncbi:holo-ACP synthase [Plasticicumulans acidivorans]|uniref:Holo-[acyl-carrier-protein] synthase n=1 Tax=Plasticicumulans acidivorans TaxID=886464 RepID=A0A317MWW1_9GAMM|nr:holo-ACP synthase [Plasticicumulans acidivorans]PWV63365.1 holo-[acyl-carrier protein] synthase [Plasticicumulans acidivorans]